MRRAFFFRRKKREREWADEFEAHFQLHIDDNVRAGMSEQEARRAALAKFGGIESVKESMRDRFTLLWLETSWSDIRYALRSFRRSPGFAFAAIGSLVLGLGASLAVFTVADNLLLRPLPYRDSSRLVMLWEQKTNGTGDHSEVSPGNYLDWKAQTDVLEGLAAVRESRSVLTDGEQAEEFGKQRVSPEFFPLLGVQPVRGRIFTAEEERSAITHDTVLLISYRLWQRWFAGDENVVGREVQVNAIPRTIIGVLPADFYFLNRDVDIWEPIGMDPSEDYRHTQGRWAWTVGRLKDGVSLRQARNRMTALGTRLQAAYPVFNKDWTVQVEPLRDSMFREAKTSLLVLLAAVAMMLAVACANVANLLLARYSSRRREIAVRASLGAGRFRVIRQLLTESVLLSLAGGIGGVLLARSAVTGLLALAPANLRQAEINLDFRVFAVAIALSLLTGIFFGLAPALVTSRLDLTGALRGDSRSGLGAGAPLRAWLVGAEVALSVILLAGGLLLSRSLAGLESVNPGLSPSNVLTFRVSLPAARYRKIPARTQYFAQAIQQMQQLPGVRSVSAASYSPFTGHGMGTFVNIEGQATAKPGEERLSLIRTVMPGYFRTLGIPVKTGREFVEADNSETAPERFIVNEAFVRQFLPGERPLEQKIQALMEPTNPFGEIIGVVGDVREWSIDRKPMPMVYYVYSHLSFTSMIFLVRAEHDPIGLSEAARRIIQRLDPAQPIAQVRTMDDVLGENLSRQRFSAWLLSGFAAIALLLAGVGIYSVLAYSVTARTRELGVRAALGANPGRIVALVLASGARPVAGGLAIGVGGAFVLTGLLKNLLFGIGPRDPVTFSAVPILLAMVALIAACLPARRAAQLDPMQSLRSD